MKISLDRWQKALIDGGKSFFAYLAASGIVNATNIDVSTVEKALLGAGIMAGLAFFTSADNGGGQQGQQQPS